MSKKKKLYPGIGAKGSILSRFLKPKLPENSEKDHRSNVLLFDFFYEGRRLNFRFHLEGDETKRVYSAISRFVKITEEGELHDLFFESDKRPKSLRDAKALLDAEKEPDKWGKSKARQLLYDDLMDGLVPLDPKDKSMSIEDIYCMRIEYAQYHFDDFEGRLDGVRKIIQDLNVRAEIDRNAFDNYVSSHEVSIFAHGGYIQWQGSDAQKLLQEDIKNKKHLTMKKFDLWSSRVEYYKEFPLKVFRDKVAQEIRTAKYLHTLELKGKAQGKLLPKRKETSGKWNCQCLERRRIDTPHQF